MSGRKDDAGKLRFDLLPFEQIREVVEVLTVGAKRYGDDNWKSVPDARRRYLAALLRHVWAFACGERNDLDDGLSHLSHAVCCALFLMRFDNKREARPFIVWPDTRWELFCGDRTIDTGVWSDGLPDDVVTKDDCVLVLTNEDK